MRNRPENQRHDGNRKYEVRGGEGGKGVENRKHAADEKGRESGATQIDQHACALSARLALSRHGLFGEIDDDGTRFALYVGDRNGVAVTRLQLSE